MEHPHVSIMERKMVVRIITIFFLCLGLEAQAQTLSFKHADLGFKFWESLPDNYNKNNTYPLIVYLHGRGERGDGTDASAENVLTWGPLRHVKHGRFKSFSYDGKSYSFIVIAPQIDKPTSLWDPALVDQVINYALKNYAVDLSRVYLTGPSLGGNGTWVYAYSDFNAENKLAAIAPIASWGNLDKACKVAVRNIPVWAFHGIDDDIIDFSRGQQIFEAAKACAENDIPEMKFTSYENTRHNSWQKAYDVRHTYHNPNIYEWMLSHQLTKQEEAKIERKLTDKTEVNIKDYEAKPSTNSLSLSKIAKLPSSLDECSGIVTDSKGNLWVHNDSGNGPFIFKLDTTGNVLAFKKIVLASNFDWEDVAIDNNDNLYIGDIGNNDNNRKKLIIYKVNLNDTSSRLSASSITFEYEDQQEFPPSLSEMNFDAESLIYLNDSLYIFSKNRTEPFDGRVKVYVLPSKEGHYKARLIDTLNLGDESGGMMDNWITGATISSDNRHIILLSHSKLWILSCFEGNKFSSAKITKVNLDTFSQKEGITFYRDKELFITDENFRNLIGGNLYRVSLNKLLQSCNNF